MNRPPSTPGAVAGTTSTEGAVDWRDRAECRDADPEIFFPPADTYRPLTPAEMSDTRVFCCVCPVTAECLAAGIKAGDALGVRGGIDMASLSERQRRKHKTQQDAGEPTDLGDGGPHALAPVDHAEVGLPAVPEMPGEVGGVTRLVVDLFAGPGGWDEGMRLLDLDAKVVGVEWDRDACRTAKAAGHARIRGDVAALDPLMFGEVAGLIASPPCQAWSMAGKRKGEFDRENCHRLADRMAAGDDSLGWTAWEDPRSALVCQPVRWVRSLRPRWVVLEEVPAVASLWEHFARIFRVWGYSVWTGDLNSADFGVPQTRVRRILIARLDGQALPPEATHAEQAQAEDLFGGAGRERWVSMAQALGWGFEEPSCTVSSGGAETGDAEPFANMGYRKRLAAFVAAGVTGQGRPKDAAPQPADTLTAKGTAYWVPTHFQSGQTVAGGPKALRAIEEPAVTIIGRTDLSEWVYRGSNQAHAAKRPLNQPAPNVNFAERANKVEWMATELADNPKASGVRVTVQEAGILQSFPADYPWTGSKSKQYLQVGNAVPPRLGAHVVAAAAGCTWSQAVERAA